MSKIAGQVLRRQGGSGSYQEYDELQFCKNGRFKRVFALNSTASGHRNTIHEGLFKVIFNTVYFFDNATGESSLIHHLKVVKYEDNFSDYMSAMNRRSELEDSWKGEVVFCTGSSKNDILNAYPEYRIK